VAAAPAPAQPVRIAYSAMSLTQRVVYEIGYTRAVLEALSAALGPPLEAPAAIAIDSFNTVTLEGQSASKESVAALLGILRTGDFSLLPKPHTAVTTTASGAFAYKAVATALFVQGNADSVMNSLPKSGVQSDNVKRLEQFAADAGVKVKGGLRYASKQKAGRLQRLVYRLDASATLADFTTFVRNVHAANLGCALGSVRVTGKTISADVFLNSIE
jgi:hypothetical protein